MLVLYYVQVNLCSMTNPKMLLIGQYTKIMLYVLSHVNLSLHASHKHNAWTSIIILLKCVRHHFFQEHINNPYIEYIAELTLLADK